MTKSTKVTQTPQIDISTLYQEMGNWSKVFRYLHSTGMSKGDIAKICGKRYQHVRNVLITPLVNKTN